jgi:pilus assembly protein CpaE
VRKQTSILLPAATIDLFLKDAKTIASARAMQDDWRFARVTIRIHDGDVESAIKFYAGGATANMIMIETDTTDESFTNRLGELSGYCEEGTSAVVIGPVNDVNLYRSLTAMGVSDYLVRPVPVETLSEVIAASLIEKLGTAGSQLIAVIGAKGGVGVTSLSQILAWGASEDLSQKTFLLDGAGAWSSLAVGMGFEPSSGTNEAIRAATSKDMDSLRRMLYQANDKLSILATGMEPMLETPAQISQFEEILNMAMSSYPVVIVDLSGAIPAVKKSVLSRAHQTVVVSTPTLASLRAARTLMGEIKKSSPGADGKIDLVINMAGIAPGKEVGKGDIRTAMDVEPAAVIAFDPKLFIGAENEGKKIATSASGSETLQKLMPILQKTISKDSATTEAGKQDNVLGGLLSKFKAKK